MKKRTVDLRHLTERNEFFLAQPWREGRLAKEWASFDAKYPEIFKELERRTCEVAATGRQHYGIDPLYGSMRYHFEIELGRADLEEEFKAPNNHRAYYARALMEAHPEWITMFRLCRLRSVHPGSPGEKDRFGLYPEDRDYDEYSVFS